MGEVVDLAPIPVYRHKVQSVSDVDNAEERLFSMGSTQRTAALIDECAMLRHELAYELFRRVWPSCDDTMPYTEEIRPILQSSIDWMTIDGQLPHEPWFDALPSRFRVYRGCNANAVNGFSWSIDREVALTFAGGHRGLHLSHPVLSSGMVRKNSILMTIGDQHEREILVEFDDLREIRVVHYPRCLL